ncbi:hypothetical protein ACJX0J_024986 [Zea mays]
MIWQAALYSEINGAKGHKKLVFHHGAIELRLDGRTWESHLAIQHENGATCIWRLFIPIVKPLQEFLNLLIGLIGLYQIVINQHVEVGENNMLKDPKGSSRVRQHFPTTLGIGLTPTSVQPHLRNGDYYKGLELDSPRVSPKRKLTLEAKSLVRGQDVPNGDHLVGGVHVAFKTCLVVVFFMLGVSNGFPC